MNCLMSRISLGYIKLVMSTIGDVWTDLDAHTMAAERVLCPEIIIPIVN